MRWRGRVEAWGLWFPPVEATPSRILASWSEGVRAWSLHGGALLIFPRAFSLRAEKGAALPLLPLGRGWSSFPGASPEVDEIVLHWAGEISGHPFRELSPLDLATLWDSTSLRYVEGARPRSKPRSEPVLVEVRQEEAREVYLAVPDAAPEQKEWLQRLHRERPERRNTNPLLGFFDLLRAHWDSRENQRYIQRMMEQFEKKNWAEALRHAIPLSDENRDALGERPNLLQARERLDFTAQNQAGSSFEASRHAFELLRTTYRKACDELLAQGRVEEAAFILGELLESPAAAVDLLESHGFYRQAARLATIKGLPAALQVRLWFLAERVDMALLLARRHFAHAEAILALQSKYPDMVPAFRRTWAQDLVDAGRLGQALVVGWETRESIPEYPSWLEEALQNGGFAACQALALAASDVGLTEQLDIPQRLTDWFDDHSLLTLERRRTVLELLAEGRARSSNKALRAWAGRTARRVMKSANTPFALGDSRVLANIVGLSGDPWLKTDTPTSLPRFAGRLGRWSERVERRGQLPLFDVAPLGDGRTLLALGQAGLAVVSAGGAIAQRFAEPVHQLVAPLEGELFLTVSDGRVGTFHKDRYRPWCRSTLDGFADAHDGYHWLVWRGTWLYQIDLTSLESSTDWRALEKRDLASVPLKAAIGAKNATVLTESDIHVLDYPHLSSSSSRFQPESDFRLLTPKKSCQLSLRDGRLFFRGVPLVHQGEIVDVDYQAPRGVVISSDREALALCFFDLEAPEKQFVLSLPGASRARVRTSGRQTYICDDLGRFLVVDVEAQAWLAQHFL